MNPDPLILRKLFSCQPDIVPSPLLAGFCGLDEKELSHRIGELCRLGYDIELIPHSGYRLRAAADILIADEIHARLPESSPSIIVFNETRSTNDLAHRYGREGQPGPFVVVAETQTHGRGRQGRNWNSKPHLGLWFSVLLRPGNLTPSQAQRLTIQSCVALHRAVFQVCQIRAAIKWPNDLLIKGKKVAGILTEAHIENSTLRYAIIGIGLNVNHTTEDFPPELQDSATSLRQNAHHHFRRADVLVAFLQELSRVLKEKWEKLREEWKDHCLNMGQPITMQLSGQTFCGQMIDIDQDGALVFRHSSGRLEVIHTGEILA